VGEKNLVKKAQEQKGTNQNLRSSKKRATSVREKIGRKRTDDTRSERKTEEKQKNGEGKKVRGAQGGQKKGRKKKKGVHSPGKTGSVGHQGRGHKRVKRPRRLKTKTKKTRDSDCGKISPWKGVKKKQRVKMETIHRRLKTRKGGGTRGPKGRTHTKNCV